MLIKAFYFVISKKRNKKKQSNARCLVYYTYLISIILILLIDWLFFTQFYYIRARLSVNRYVQLKNVIATTMILMISNLITENKKRAEIIKWIRMNYVHFGKNVCRIVLALHTNTQQRNEKKRIKFEIKFVYTTKLARRAKKLSPFT